MPLRAIPGVKRDAGGFVQAMQVFDEATVVTLDTLNEAAPNHEGLLCAARLEFLETALRFAPDDRPLLLFQHHPPFDTGLRYMDTIRLANPEAEWDVIARTRRPDYMFMGHLHRPIAGLWNGIPFHIQRALAHQVAFDLETEGHIPGSHEAPDYSHVSVGGGQIVIPHVCRPALLAARQGGAGRDAGVRRDEFGDTGGTHLSLRRGESSSRLMASPTPQPSAGRPSRGSCRAG